MTQRVLAKDITLFQAIALGINTTIGAGILIMPGLVASQTGIAVLLNALLCFVVSVTVALSLSELATGLPRAGGSYYYINRSLGPFWGCVAGITQGISLMFAMAFCAVCFGFYLQYLWPQLAALPITIARILFLVITHVIGSRSHPLRRILLTIGLVSLLVVPALQGFLSLQASLEAGSSLDVFRDASPWTHWRQGIAGAGIFFIAFLGFETIADVGEEVQTPQRTIPLSMLTTIAVVSILYLPLLIVCLEILPLDEFLKSQAPLSLLADQLWQRWGVLVVTVGVFFATATSTSALALSANRLTFAMSRDGLLSPWLSQISPRFRTPIRSIGLMGAIVLTLIFVQDVTLLAAIASFAYLLTYSLVHLALIVLRFVQPDWYQPRFRCPGYPATPLLGLGLMLLMILNLPIRIFVFGTGIVAIAGIWYWKVARFRVVASGELDSFADSLNPAPCYTVLLPVANPRTEATLVRLATAIAFSHQDQPDSQAQLVGMTAIETPPQAALEQQLLSQQRRIESQQALLEQVRKHVEQARQAYRAKDSNPANLQVQLINVASRSLAGAVLDLTRQTDANLIILGWPSISSMPERLYGTAIGTLVQKAPCDVCVLKLTYDQFQRVLVPVGFGPNTRLTVGIALAIAQGLGVPIEFISVTQPAHPLFGNANTLQDRWQEMALTLGIKPQPLHLLEPGPVVERLAAYAEPEDLVCIGSNRSVRFQRLLFGTIPEAIARETTSSVLLVRQQDPVQRWLKIWPFHSQRSADEKLG